MWAPHTLLGNFLNSKRHISRILDLRAETDENRKKAIKLVARGYGERVVQPRHGKSSICKGIAVFICLDIDGKDNPGRSVDVNQGGNCSFPFP